MPVDVEAGEANNRADRADHPTPSGSRWWLVPLGVYALTRALDTVLLMVMGRSQIDPSTLPVAPHRPPLETGRSYDALVANWDGQWYRYIIEHGYPTHLPTVHGAVQENQWAFYPLYPAIVRVVMGTGISYGVAASLVSLVFGASAMCLLYRALLSRLGGFAASMSVLALCVAPAAVIWQAAYTESLALFLVLATLISLSARRYGVALAFALALSLTRPIVLPVAAVMAIHGYVRWRQRHQDPFLPGERVRLLLVTATTAVSFVIWPVVAAVVTGHEDAYFATQRAWLSPGVGGWPTWFVAVMHGTAPALLVVLPLAGAALVYALFRKQARGWGLEFRAWSLVYVAYLLGSTTPTTSVFRYAMLSVVPWWPFPEVDAQVPGRRDRVALAVLVILIGVAMQFVWLRWFFVITPATLERP